MGSSDPQSDLHFSPSVDTASRGQVQIPTYLLQVFALLSVSRTWWFDLSLGSRRYHSCFCLVSLSAGFSVKDKCNTKQKYSFRVYLSCPYSVELPAFGRAVESASQTL